MSHGDLAEECVQTGAVGRAPQSGDAVQSDALAFGRVQRLVAAPVCVVSRCA